ncbi:putative ribonuclease H-like domain-containing protein [Tanacetum coccineum]
MKPFQFTLFTLGGIVFNVSMAVLSLPKASNKGDAPAKPPQIITTNTLSNIKLPVLQKDDYDTWAMEMEHYLEYIDNEVWKVIQNGNSKKRVTKGKDGVYRVLPPTHTEEQVSDENKKGKHLNITANGCSKRSSQSFHAWMMPKVIWAAIRQGYDRFQKLLSQLDALGAGVSDEDANHKFLRSLPPAWDSLAMTMRTKKNIDTLSIDDLYNNLSVFEQDIQKTSSSSLASDNVAFLSQAKASSSKHKPSHSSGSYSSYTTSSSKATPTATPGLADEVIHSFLATNADDVDLIHEDLDQIDDLDLEEMDINWQIAMTAIKIKKFYKKTGRRPRVDGKMHVAFDKRKVECFNCHNTGHFARECKFKGSKEGSRQEAGRGQDFKPVRTEKEALMTIDEGQINWVEQTTDEELNHALMAFTVNNEVSMCSKLCLDSYNALQAKYDELQSEFGNQEAALVAHKIAVKKLESQLRASHKQQSSLNEKLNFQANQIFEKDEKLKKYRRIGMKAVKVKDAPLTNPTPFTNKIDNLPRYLLLSRLHVSSGTHIKSGTSSFNTGKQHVNSGSMYVNSGTKNKSGGSRVNTGNQNDHPLKHMEHRGIFDSGCSGHMTGNRAHLEDYQELSKVGSVTFGDVMDVSVVKDMCKKLMYFLLKECFVVSSDFKMPDENQTEVAEETPLWFLLLLDYSSWTLNKCYNEESSSKKPSLYDQYPKRGISDDDDDEMPEIRIYDKSSEGIFEQASYDDDGVITDFNNLPDEVDVITNPTLRIHNAHPQSQILGDPNTPVQTRSSLKKITEAHALVSYIQAHQRSNHKDQQHCLFACFLSQFEPRKVTEALEDGSWVEAMQEELLQFKLQQVWVFGDLPNGAKEKHGYKRGTIDKTLFIRRNKKDIMLVQVYVDDIIFGSTNKSWCADFEALMQSRFQMSSMGELTFFLGLQVKQNKDGIFISQDKYVAEMLKKFDLVNVKAAITPMETKLPLTKDEDAFDVDVHLYRSMIGSLMYLTASRPDIMYAVCVCSRFQVSPKTSHLNAVKRIFKYLKGKPNLGLWYPRDSPLDLEAFSDSDYGGSNLDRKSTTGGCQFLGQRLISWQCKKQTIVATSTTEAEYVAAAHCCGQVLWVQNQLLDYGFNFMNTKIHIDNESTICIVKNPVYHSKTKHIEIRHHFIRDCYEKKLISVTKIHTDLNVADLLTKPFDGPRFNYLVVSIGTLVLEKSDARSIGHEKKMPGVTLLIGSIWLYSNDVCIKEDILLPEKSKRFRVRFKKIQLSPSTLEAAQILTNVVFRRVPDSAQVNTAQVNTAQVNTAELNPDSTSSAQINTGEVNAAEVNTGEVNAAEVNTGEAERAQRRKGKEPMTEEDLQAEVQASKTSKELQELADLEEAKRVQAQMDAETQRQIDLDALLARRLVEQEEEASREALATEFDYIQARLNADQILAEKIQQEERGEQYLLRRKSKVPYIDTIAAPKYCMRDKKQDQDFCGYWLYRSERAHQKMNEKDADKEEEKKDESVHEEAQEEEGAKKRKLGTRRKLKAKRRKHGSSLTREDDDLKICLHISPDEDKQETGKRKLYALETDQVFVRINNCEEFADSEWDDETVTSTHEDVGNGFQLYIGHTLLGGKELTTPELMANWLLIQELKIVAGKDLKTIKFIILKTGV